MNDATVETVVAPPRIHKVRKHQCQYTNYTVRRPDGVLVNEILYLGKVNVPSCLANTLSEQDQNWEQTEVKLMHDGGGPRVVGSFKG